MKKLLLISIIVFSSSILHSEEFDYLYRGARPMGMGGAFTAVSDGVNALFYNPAGLNRIKPGEGEVVILNPMIALNSSAMNVIGDIKGGLTSDIIDTLQPYIGKNMHINVATSMPYWTRHNFAIALLLPNVKNNTILRRQVATQAIEHLIIDTGLLVGYAHGFFQDRLSVGVNLKFLVRGAAYFLFDAEQLYTKRAVNFSDIGGYGFGIDGDIGALYTFNKVWFFTPSVGLSINNIGATKFPTRFGSSTSVSELPERFRLQRSVSIGGKFELPNVWKLRKWILAVDVNHIGIHSSFFKKFHVGMETWLLSFFGIRGGINQGYFTFGITFDIPVIQIDFFTYAEELGGTAGAKGDRRIGLQVSFGF